MSKKEILGVVIKLLDIDSELQKENILKLTFHDIGLDSIDILDLIVQCEDTFNIVIEDQAVVRMRTLQDLIIYISKKCKTNEKL